MSIYICSLERQLKRHQRAGRKNLPLVDMDDKVGLDIKKFLKDNGAIDVGTQESIGGSVNHQKIYMRKL